MSLSVGIRHVLLALSAIVCTLWAVQSCPEKYRRYSAQHSFCLPRCCGCPFYKRGITKELKNQILHLHNNYRSGVAGGNTYGVGHLPRAANMLEMVWDDELADIAQKWVDSCKRSYDCDLCRMVERFAVSQSKVEFQGSIMEPVDLNMEFFMYHNALETLQKKHITRYSESDGKGGVTQLLWAKTWRVGCGFLYFRDPNGQKYSILQCNYGPRGNIEGEEVYKADKVCSACPANTCCGDGCKKHKIKAYDGLCKVIDENLPPEGTEPHQKSGKEVFYCGFNGESDCSYTVDGVDRWTKKSSNGGTRLTTYLGSGGYTVLKFGEPIVSKSGKLCLGVTTRSGPTEAEKPYNYELVGQLEEESKYLTTIVFPKAEEKTKHFFHTDYFQPAEFPKNRGAKLTLSFSVPYNHPKQYLEIERIVAREGDCLKVTAQEGSGFSTSG